MSTPPEHEGSPDPVAPARRRGPGPAIYGALALAVLVTGGLGALIVHLRSTATPSSELRASGLPSSVSTSLANQMTLSEVPTRMAPDFTLTDQTGRSRSLRDFRGRAVVLEFMDPHCTDICPLVSQEFVDAFHNLGPRASHVVFMAVNVNQYFASVASVNRFSNEHELNTIPSWHFFTGSPSALAAVWRSYGVQVSAPNPKADIVHTSVLYFIDPQGRERYIASPIVEHTSTGKSFLPPASITAWAKGIELVTRSLIP